MQPKSWHALAAGALVCLIFASPFQTHASRLAEGVSSSPQEAALFEADDYPVDLIGQIGGQAVRVTIQGDYAYLSLGFKLAVLDVSDPTAPRLKSEVALEGQAGEVVAAGDYAYIVVDQPYVDNVTQLTIVDVSDPAAGEVTASIKLESHTSGLAVYGGYVYAAELGIWSGGGYSGGGVRMVDVRDPAAPRNAGYYDTPGVPRDLAVEGQTLYLAEGQSKQFGNIPEPGVGGLRIFSLQDPAAPAPRGYFPASQNTDRVAVSSGLVYLLEIASAQLWIIDATSPFAPVELSRIKLPGEALSLVDLSVTGGWVYVSENGGTFDPTPSLRIVDARDPRRPQVQPDADLPAGSYPQGLAATVGRLYLCAGSGGLQVMDLANPAVPVLQGAYVQPGSVNAAAVAGRKAYLTDGQDLYVVDLSQLDRPRLASRLPTDQSIADVTAAGDLVFLAGQGLQVVDASDPTAPRRIGFVPAEAVGYQKIVLQGRYAYLSVAEPWKAGGGLRIFDISDPSAPTLAGSLDFPLPVYSLAVAGEYVYLTNGGNVLIVRVSDPQNPVPVDLPEPIPGFGLELVGSHLFVVDAQDFIGTPTELFIRVLDLSAPTAPREVGRFGDWTGIMGMDASGRYFYLASSGSSIQETGEVGIVEVWDIADLAHPTRISAYHPTIDSFTGGGLQDLVVSEGNAYLSAGTTGLLILRYAGSADGRVTDFHGKPAADVSVAAGDVATALTDAGGSFNFSRLPWDDYTLSPELAGYAFWPPRQEIVVTGAAHNLNFTLLAAPVSTALEPGLPASLSYTDTQGLPTSIDLPAGAAPLAATLTITPTLVPRQSSFQFGGHAFSLGASPGFLPAAPFSVSIQYSDLDAGLITKEEELRLLRWTAAGWEDAAQTCTPASAYRRDPAGNTLRLPVCQFGLFALVRPGYTMYLPLTARQR